MYVRIYVYDLVYEYAYVLVSGFLCLCMYEQMSVCVWCRVSIVSDPRIEMFSRSLCTTTPEYSIRNVAGVPVCEKHCYKSLLLLEIGRSVSLKSYRLTLTLTTNNCDNKSNAVLSCSMKMLNPMHLVLSTIMHCFDMSK